jgi:GAF domain-containing protein/HAMP domain-containing protein
VIYLQDRAVLDASLKSQNLLSSTISTLLAGLAGILITIVANLFSAPIQRLTKAAEQVSQGNLDVRAGIKSNDEIGVLGNSFDLMTEQLKDFIDDLENRVSERTNKLAQQNDSLQFKTRQLRTVSDVARSIVSTREVDTLLSTVANLISERFDFYHVGIFLLDEIGDYAILRAANSAGGQNMLARKHRLKVGQEGIVGYVTGTGEPRIATDVGEDSVYFNNPDLPYTKSEMALPLKLGDKVIGALDVQSTGSNAFYMEDVELFSTLADQLAIAIYNNQLYEASNKALEETQRLYNEYLRQEWSRRNLDAGKKNFKYTIDGLVPFEEDLPEINMVLNSARPVFRSVKSTNGSEEIKSVMAVPIILNEEPIGAIYLQENSTHDYVWSQNELFTVQAVADQVALTLENARLFEQTVRRADRERKVLEITSKIRSTNDPQEMLKITLEELRQNLGVQQAQIILSVKNNGLPVIKTGEKTNQVKLHPEESTGAL